MVERLRMPDADITGTSGTPPKEENSVPSREVTAQEILNTHPDFKNKATKESAILGYNKKFYALGLVDINQEGEYKGHAKSGNITYWDDYGRSVPYIDFLRQIDLHIENKLDAYTGGRDEANYNFEKDHYILYETRKLKGPQESNGQLHIDNADALYLYDTGTRNVGKPDANDPKYGQAEDIIESLRLPQGSITERFYLKHSRACPPEVFVEACIESGSINGAISEMDKSDLRKAMNFFTSKSYMNFTAAADFIDKEKYDYVHLPNGHLVVLNQKVLLNPEEIAKKELSQSENARVEEMYGKYLAQDSSNVIRGGEEDLKQFTKFLQSL